MSSYGNESLDAIFFDGFMISCGYFLMLAYTCLILGKLVIINFNLTVVKPKAEAKPGSYSVAMTLIMP